MTATVAIVATLAVLAAALFILGEQLLWHSLW